MAVKAKAEITISRITDIQSVTRYYLLQSSSSAAPSKPTVNPPGGNWVTTEPAFQNGSTNTLYFVDQTIYTNGEVSYSAVSKSSSYEAAKEAYNKATSAKDAADSANEKVDNMEIGDRNLLLESGETITNSYYPLATYYFGDEKPIQGEVYTIVMKASLGEGKMYFGLYNSGGTYGVVEMWPDHFDNNGICKRTFKWTGAASGQSSNTYLNVYPIQYPIKTESTVEWIKLVKGNTASLMWTPAPEDAMDDVGVEYYLSTSATSLSGGTWSTTAPEWVDGKYMWSRTVKIDGAGNKTYSPSQNGVCIAGAKGVTGEKGDKGDKGDTGATGPQGEKGDTGATGPQGKDGTDGRSVKSVTRYYILATPKPTTPSTSWSTIEPTLDETTDTTLTLYFADLTTWSDNSTPTWSAISVSSSYEVAAGAQETANDAAAKADLVSGVVSGTDTFDISVSGSLSEESAQIDIQVASGSGKFTTPGEYTFSYSGSGWTLDGNSVTLSDYGITLNGTPVAGDTITVVYDDSGLVDEINELNRRADEISSDVGSLSDAASALQEQADGLSEATSKLQERADDLSEATSKLQTVQETASKEMAGIAKEMEGYRGCVVIDGSKPSITVGAGSDAKTNIKITPEKMSFMNNGNEAASLSNDTLKADSAEITNLYMRSVDDSGNAVGTLGWIARANGHLSLRVIG